MPEKNCSHQLSSQKDVTYKVAGLTRVLVLAMQMPARSCARAGCWNQKTGPGEQASLSTGPCQSHLCPCQILLHLLPPGMSMSTWGEQLGMSYVLSSDAKGTHAT